MLILAWTRDTNQYIDLQYIDQYIDIANINIDFQKNQYIGHILAIFNININIDF